MKVSAFGPPKFAAAAIAALWLLAHLPFLAPSLEDIDSINFALGLRHFDPALHQPHPPGYPVYIALGRASLAMVSRVAPGLTAVRADALALAVWSALFGALAIVGAARLFGALEVRQDAALGASGPSVATWGAGLLAVTPLFWMTGLRPMSDMPGLALVLWSQALALEEDRGRRLWVAALLAGLAGGVRIQTLALTLPLLLFRLVERRAVQPLVAFAIGVLAWAVPLVMATGGPAGYVRALGAQAAEDFGWVNMLWSHPTPRRLAFALYESFALPWASSPLAVVIAVLAAAGLLVTLVRARGSLALMLIAFGFYIPYHLLFQETVTVRYSLPTLPLVVWLAVQGLALARRWFVVSAAAVAAAALVVAVPGGMAYGDEAHPAFRAIADANRAAATAPPAATYSHYEIRRPLQAAASPGLQVVEPRRLYEWLGLVDYWRSGGTRPIWFFADPKRTDLALIDPASRRDVVRYRWAVEDRDELSGTRPLGVDWYRLNPPGWFAGEGWSLTPEAGGVTSAAASGPDVRPIEAWVRRGGPMHLMVGGRHLGNPGDPAAEFELSIDGALVDRWRLDVSERNFLRFVDLPEGLPPGAFSYARLLIASRSADGDARRATVAVRQFDAQPVSRMIYGFGEGWHEEEYEAETGRRWRWTSERSILRVQGPPLAVRVTLRGESPVKYVGAPPTVKVVAGGRVVGQFAPADDFMWSVTVPADAWMASQGAIAVETDRIYLPGPAEGTSDMRHLGLRLFEIGVDQVQP